MKSRWAIIVALITLVLVFPNFTITFAQDPVNEVRASFDHAYSYSTWGDSIVNIPLVFSNHWSLAVDNISDSSGESVVIPKLVVESTLDFVGFSPWHPNVSPPRSLYLGFQWLGGQRSRTSS